jgi:hypothetical protein
VALGALGGAVSPWDVITGRDDRDALDAYTLALVLSPMSIPEKRACLVALRDRLSQDLCEWLNEMIERLDAGDTIGVVM